MSTAEQGSEPSTSTLQRTGTALTSVSMNTGEDELSDREWDMLDTIGEASDVTGPAASSITDMSSPLTVEELERRNLADSDTMSHDRTESGMYLPMAEEAGALDEIDRLTDTSLSDPEGPLSPIAPSDTATIGTKAPMAGAASIGSATPSGLSSSLGPPGIATIRGAFQGSLTTEAMDETPMPSPSPEGATSTDLDWKVDPPGTGLTDPTATMKDGSNHHTKTVSSMTEEALELHESVEVTYNPRRISQSRQREIQASERKKSVESGAYGGGGSSDSSPGGIGPGQGPIGTTTGSITLESESTLAVHLGNGSSDDEDDDGKIGDKPSVIASPLGGGNMTVDILEESDHDDLMSGVMDGRGSSSGNISEDELLDGLRPLRTEQGDKADDEPDDLMFVRGGGDDHGVVARHSITGAMASAGTVQTLLAERVGAGASIIREMDDDGASAAGRRGSIEGDTNSEVTEEPQPTPTSKIDDDVAQRLRRKLSESDAPVQQLSEESDEETQAVPDISFAQKLIYSSAENTKLRRQIAALEAEIADLHETVETYEAELGDRDQDYENLELDYEDLNNRKQKDDVELQRLQTTVEEQLRRIQMLEESAERTQTVQEDLKRENQNLRIRLEDVTHKHSQSQTQLTISQDDLRRGNDEISEKDDQIIKLRNEITQLEKDVAELTEVAEDHVIEKMDMEKSIAKEQGRNEALNKQLKTTMEELKEFKKENDQLFDINEELSTLVEQQGSVLEQIDPPRGFDEETFGVLKKKSMLITSQSRQLSTDSRMSSRKIMSLSGVGELAGHIARLSSMSEILKTGDLEDVIAQETAEALAIQEAAEEAAALELEKEAMLAAEDEKETVPEEPVERGPVVVVPDWAEPPEWFIQAFEQMKSSTGLPGTRRWSLATPHKHDALREFFYLLCLCIKLKLSHKYGLTPDVAPSNASLWQQAQANNILFHDYYDYLITELRIIFEAKVTVGHGLYHRIVVTEPSEIAKMREIREKYEAQQKELENKSGDESTATGDESITGWFSSWFSGDASSAEATVGDADADSADDDDSAEPSQPLSAVEERAASIRDESGLTLKQIYGGAVSERNHQRYSGS